MMKKLLVILVLGLFTSWSVNADIKLTSETTINDVLNDGYRITKEDTIQSKNNKSFIKVFTLEALNSYIIICTVGFDNDGFLNQKTLCYKP